MKVCAALCWYDEPVEFLDRLVRSLAGVVDAVVAVDGAWKLFPGGPLSPVEQNDALRAAAAAIGVPVETWAPNRLWESQLAKRASAMELAAEHGDWTLVVDADEYVTHADADTIRSLLAATETVCADVTLKNLRGGFGGLRRRFYRAGTSLRLVHTGYTYRGRDLLPGEPTLDLSRYLTIEHDYRNRGAVRNAKDDAYRDARQRERVEVWV